jgi:hypothetical protein
MRRSFTLLAGAMTAFMLFIAPAAGAAGPARTQTWNMSGTNTIDFTCAAICTSPGVPHLINITSDDLLTGVLSGNGYYTVDPSYTWNVSGQVAGDALTMRLDYTGTNFGYFVNMNGTIDANGYMSGTATDSANQPFTWYATGLVAATDYNHGQFVTSYADKAAMAQSSLGKPLH